MKLKIYNSILMTVIAACLIAITVILLLWPKTEAAKTETRDEAAANEVIDSAESVDMMEIKTPYGTLNYPEKWKDMVKFTESTEGDVYTGTFYCLMKDQEIPMFYIYFGAKENGTLIGYVLKDDQNVPFNVRSSDFEPDETWTDDERMLYLGMCNAINDVINSVTAGENYVG